MKKDEPYRQFVPGIGLSLERNTDTVPKDGSFYVIRNGDVVGRFRSLKDAQLEYVAIRDTLVVPKIPVAADDESTLAMDNYFMAKEMYWSQSHNFGRGGGKGGRGGV